MALSSVSLTKSLPKNDSNYRVFSPITLTSQIQSSNIQFPTNKPIFHERLTTSNTSPTTASTTRTPKVSFFPAFFTRKDAQTLKLDLLEAIQPLDRGADASPEDQQFIDKVLCLSTLLSFHFVTIIYLFFKKKFNF